METKEPRNVKNFCPIVHLILVVNKNLFLKGVCMRQELAREQQEPRKPGKCLDIRLTRSALLSASSVQQNPRQNEGIILNGHKSNGAS